MIDRGRHFPTNDTLGHNNDDYSRPSNKLCERFVVSALFLIMSLRGGSKVHPSNRHMYSIHDDIDSATGQTRVVAFSSHDPTTRTTESNNS